MENPTIENEEKNIPEGRKLCNMKTNMEIREKVKREKSNLPFKGMYLYVELIKEQNRKILSQIAKDKFIHKEGREDFINKYMKLNYQIPDIIEDKELEINQDIYP
tara:strand:+ start:740 stop:1054 length:315 start_codon:yes stop_codon:yes gene_type:complete